MFSFKLAEDFRHRSQKNAPYPRGAVASGESGHTQWAPTHVSGFAALGAILLGALLMTANMARQNSLETATADATGVLAKPETITKTEPQAPPNTSVVAPPPTYAAKSTERVDMSATGAIPADPPQKPKHKPRVRKIKSMDPSERGN